MPVPDPGAINVDIDRETGLTITGWPVVAQSIRNLILTSPGERVRREWVGSLVATALGRTLSEDTILRVYTSIAIVLDAFEPRFVVRRFEPATMDTRAGALRLIITGDYLPRGLLGDETVLEPGRVEAVVPTSV